MNVNRNRSSPADDAGKVKPQPKPDAADVAGQMPLFAGVLAAQVAHPNRKAGRAPKEKPRLKDAELADLLRQQRPVGKRTCRRPAYDVAAVRGGVVL